MQKSIIQKIYQIIKINQVSTLLIHTSDNNFHCYIVILIDKTIHVGTLILLDTLD